MLNSRDTATVLFALREFQARLHMEAGMAEDMTMSGHFDGIELPTVDDIDDLCQRLNAPAYYLVVVEDCVEMTIHGPFDNWDTLEENALQKVNPDDDYAGYFDANENPPTFGDFGGEFFDDAQEEDDD